MVNSTALRGKAIRAHATGDYKTAKIIYQKLIEYMPEINEIINLGALYRSTGDITEGRKHYEKWLEHFPSSKILRMNASNFFCEAKDFDKAELVLRPLLRDKQWHENGDVAACKARILVGQSKVTQALKIFQKLISKDPNCIDNLMSLAVCLNQLNKNNEALEIYERAQKLDNDNLKIKGNRVTLLRLLGRGKEAHHLLNSLSGEERQDPAIMLAEAALEQTEKNYEKSANLNIKLCKSQPFNCCLWVNLAANLKSLRKVYSSHKAIQKGLKIDPSNIELLQILAQSFAERGQYEKSRVIINRIKYSQHMQKTQHMLQLQFSCSSYNLLAQTELAAIAKKWEDRIQRQIHTGIKKGTKNSNNKIRIAYYSSDLCNHPVGRFLQGILENHDSKKFDVLLLDTGSNKDKIYHELENCVEPIINLANLEACVIDNIIRELEIDILIELGGYTNHSRIDALINKPATIQLSYLGYPAPTYLNAIDGWIGDEIVFRNLSSFNRQAHNLYCIKGGYMAYSRFKDYPAIDKSSLKDRKFRFGCFNHNRKLTSDTIKLWARIMDANLDCELVLKSVSFNEESEKQRVKQRFSNFGIDINRLVILSETISQSEHLELYSEIDIALDPTPYNGATTTCDALMMGVPVITLSGKEMVGQLSSSILYFSQLSEWIAYDKDQYVEIARKSYQSRPRTYADRIQLRRHLFNSSFADSKRLAEELEDLYTYLAKNKNSIR